MFLNISAVALQGAAVFYFRQTLNKQLEMIFMSSHQLQTLKKDSHELGTYAEKLLKKGQADLASKIKKKQQYLDRHIEMAIEAA